MVEFKFHRDVAPCEDLFPQTAKGRRVEEIRRGRNTTAERNICPAVSDEQKRLNTDSRSDSGKPLRSEKLFCNGQLGLGRITEYKLHANFCN